MDVLLQDAQPAAALWPSCAARCSQLHLQHMQRVSPGSAPVLWRVRRVSGCRAASVLHVCRAVTPTWGRRDAGPGWPCRLEGSAQPSARWAQSARARWCCKVWLLTRWLQQALDSWSSCCRRPCAAARRAHALVGQASRSGVLAYGAVRPGCCGGGCGKGGAPPAWAAAPPGRDGPCGARRCGRCWCIGLVRLWA